MNILLVHEHYGVHEKRFARAFVQRGHSVAPISISALAAEQLDINSVFDPSDQPMVIFGGPLHLLDGVEEFVESVAIVVVSYAYDILYLAKHDPLVKSKINSVMSFCDGLVADCNIVALQALKCCKRCPPPPSCVAAWGLDRAEEKYLDDGHLTQTIREQFGWPSDGLVIVSIRHFTPLHGVSSLVDVFLKIALQQLNIHLLLVGEGEDYASIQQSVIDSDCCNLVGFLGCIDEAAIPGVLEQADLYVSTSKVDGISISLLQALDAGLPVVLSAVGGNLDLKDSLDPSLFFLADDPNELELALLNGIAASGRCPGRWSGLLSQKANWEENANDIVNFTESVALAKFQP